MGFRGLVGLVLLGALALGASGCSKEEEAEAGFFSVNCGPEDQRESYFPPLPGGVVHARIDPNFSDTERADIENAVRSWNAIGGSEVGRDLFKSERSYASAMSLPDNRGDCDKVFGTTDAFSIVSTTDSNAWASLGLTSANPAITIRCSTDNGQKLQKQVVVINTSYARGSQFRSIVLHELGHAVGLNHSCDDQHGGSDRYAGCSGLAADHPYHAAVLYPFLQGGATGRAAERKEDLRSNDLDRVRCLYTGK